MNIVYKIKLVGGFHIHCLAKNKVATKKKRAL